MKSIYIKELERYNLSQIKKIFNFSDIKCNEFLNELLSKNIIKIDLGRKYYFNFVGLVIYDEFIIKCYPKYINNTKKPNKEINQILKLMKFMINSKSNLNRFDLMNYEVSNNILPLINEIIEMYYQKGLYTKHASISVLNGLNDIDWNRTINEFHPILINERPIYSDWLSKKNEIDGNNLITRIHKCVLQDCFSIINNLELNDLFDIEYNILTDIKLIDVGDKYYLINTIENEINTQYNADKIYLLKILRRYIEYKSENNDEALSFIYGTDNFKQIWEDVCQKVMDDKKDYYTDEILKFKDNLHYNGNLIKNIIPKPTWYSENNNLIGKSKESLRPDIISITEKNKEIIFTIYDAKYYNPILDENKKIEGYPGISDITKQYVYELAYKDFINRNDIKYVYNCFLIPTENNNIENKGYVEFEPFSTIGLSKINIRYLPAKNVYDMYMKDKKYNIDDLNLS